MFKIGKLVEFVYHGKRRLVAIEKVVKGPSVYRGIVLSIMGWDYTACDTPGGGYRTFLTHKIINPSEWGKVKTSKV